MSLLSKVSTFVKRALTLITVLIPAASFAQGESDVIDFLHSGKDDATKLLGAYVSPAIEGLSYSFNGGWYHTAKAHKTLGFDLGISANAVFIPASKEYFNPSQLGLTNVVLLDPASGKAPTLIGPETSTTYQLNHDSDGDGINDVIPGPEGLNFKENIGVRGVAAPMAQLGVGIYKNTDLKIRFVPEIDAGDSRFKLFGVGVLHDIKQHIPGIKTLPFDLSMLVAFTNIQAATLVEGEFKKPLNDQRTQELAYSMNAWLVQALISKKISVITFYGGIGYNAVKTNTDLKGSYMLPDDDLNDTNNEILKDPISLGFKNNSLKVTAGIRFKFGPIYLNGDYSIQEYNTLSVGLGVAVR